MHMEAQVLGQPIYLIDGEEFHFVGRRPEVLFVYLLLNQGGRHSRHKLAQLLEGEQTDDQQTRRRLTRTLNEIRHECHCPGQPASSILDPILQTDTDWVWIEGDLRVDAVEMRRAMVAARRGNLGPGDALGLSRALARYRGRFMQGISVKDTRGLDIWCEQEANALEQDFLRSALVLSLYYSRAQNYPAAEEWLLKYLAQEQHHELPYCLLMLLYRLQSDNERLAHIRGRAIRAFAGEDDPAQVNSMYQRLIIGEPDNEKLANILRDVMHEQDLNTATVGTILEDAVHAFRLSQSPALSMESRQTLDAARHLAGRNGFRYASRLLWLIAILESGAEVVTAELRPWLDPTAVALAARTVLGNGRGGHTGHIPFSPQTYAVLEAATQRSVRRSQAFTDLRTILIVLLEQESVRQLLQSLNVNWPELSLHLQREARDGKPLPRSLGRS